MGDRERPSAEEVLRRLKLSRTDPASPPTEAQVRTLATGETRSGGGTKAPDEEVLRRERLQVVREGEKPFPLKEPSWLRALVEKKASDDEVIDAVEKRVRRAPTRENLLVAQALAHDLAKKRGSGERLRKILTQELVNEIIEKGG
ncbi:MAG TPA: hypothetical protein VLQ45_31800 [Thermoanaerobaculia bacterium]|nr:hypothetical protein [Thermoanaerobaculia bacterium]